MSSPKIKRWEKSPKKIIFQKNFFKKSYNGKWDFGFKGRVIINILFILIKKKGRYRLWNPKCQKFISGRMKIRKFRKLFLLASLDAARVPDAESLICEVSILLAEEQGPEYSLRFQRTNQIIFYMPKLLLQAGADELCPICSHARPD